MPTDTTERIAPAASELQTLVVVSGAHLISHLHIMVLPVLLPLLKEQMNVGFFELGLALTTFNVVTGVTQAPMGFLVDRVGAKIVLIAGLMLGGLAFMSLGFTSTYAWLFVTAVLAGLANCVYHPADYAILTDSIAEDRIGRAFSIHTFAGFVGGAIAPPLLLGLAAVGGLSSSLVCAGTARLGDRRRGVPDPRPAAGGRARAGRQRGRRGRQHRQRPVAGGARPHRLLHPARAVAWRHVQLLGRRPDRRPRRVAGGRDCRSDGLPRRLGRGRAGGRRARRQDAAPWRCGGCRLRPFRPHRAVHRDASRFPRWC